MMSSCAQDADGAVAKAECQPQIRPGAEPWCGDDASRTRRRVLCGIRTPFWWLDHRDGERRPGGPADDYEPRPRRVVRVADDIPNVLQRLEADCEGQYLPGQVAGDADTVAGDEAEDGFAEWNAVGRDHRGDHEHCACRRETWVRGGPLGPHRPDPQRGCRCECCRPRAAPGSPPAKAPPACSRPPAETWRPRPPFWWWCHDKRSERPGGDPSLYAPVLPAKTSQPQPPLGHTFELDHPDFYLPGQIAFGFKPSVCRYWRPLPEECPDDYMELSGLVQDVSERPPQRCGAATSCSDHGGHPWPVALLPSLVRSEVAGARCAPPQRTVRRPEPCCCRLESCSTCCRRSVDELASMRPYGWRGWPGVKTAHMFYRDLHPCHRLAHCTRCKC